MKSIWKYSLETIDEQFIDMPTGAKPLSIQVQNGQPCLWMLVNSNPVQFRPTKIVIHGTGHLANDVDDLQFVGTYQLHNGLFVGHVWVEVTK